MGSLHSARYGLSLPNRGVLIGALTPGDLLDLAAAAEQTGFFHSVWVGDSLIHKPRLEALITLAGIAARTGTLRLGTVCLATFPIRHPVWLAAQWASLDVVSGGRTILGACIGGGLHAELEPFGVTPAERVGRMTEGITLLRRLWTEDAVTHHGGYYRIDGMSLEPKPVQRPCPIWIASNPKEPLTSSPLVQRAMARIGRLGDGYMTDRISPGEFAARWAFVREAAGAAGRDPGRLESAIHLMVNVNADPRRAYEEAKRFLDTYYSYDATPEIMDLWVAYGPPDTVAEKIHRYVEAGCTLPILRFASFDQRSQLELAARSVMPQLHHD